MTANTQHRHLPATSGHKETSNETAIEPSKAGTGAIVLEPNERDILCGQDKNFNLHAGNRRFKEMLSTYASVYHEASTKHGKMTIIKGIVETLQTTYDARFLRPAAAAGAAEGEERGWEELNAKGARDKVSHALRWILLGKTRATSGSKAKGTRKRRIPTGRNSGSSIGQKSARNPLHPKDVANKENKPNCQDDVIFDKLLSNQKRIFEHMLSSYNDGQGKESPVIPLAAPSSPIAQEISSVPSDQYCSKSTAPLTDMPSPSAPATDLPIFDEPLNLPDLGSLMNALIEDDNLLML